MPSNMTYDEFLAARRNSIGASDIAALYHDVFNAHDRILQSKVSPDGQSSFKGNLSTRRGQYLEAFVADEFSRTLPDGYTLREVDPVWRTLDGIPCHASPDRLVYSSPDGYPCGGVEIKTAFKGYARDMFEAGMVPDSYYAQVQWTMLVLDVPVWAVVADTGDTRLHIIEVPASPEFQNMLLEVAAAFWTGEVLPAREEFENMCADRAEFEAENNVYWGISGRQY